MWDSAAVAHVLNYWIMTCDYQNIESYDHNNDSYAT